MGDKGAILLCNAPSPRIHRCGAVPKRTAPYGLLSRFVERELELLCTNSDLRFFFDRAEGLAKYLIQNGAVITDGSTFGVSEAERFTVCLCESSRFRGLAVISGTLS
jgi:hypothetical protein